MACCGAGEICGLDNYVSPKKIIESASRKHMAWLVAFFLKPKGHKKWKGVKLMKAMKKYGFKPGRVFINPNTGNTLQPYTYLLPKKDRANPDLHNPNDPFALPENFGWAEDDL